MGTALKPYQEPYQDFDGQQRQPVSFDVAVDVVNPQPVSLPIQPRTAHYPLVHQPLPRSRPSSARLQPQISVSRQGRLPQPQLQLQPQLRVMSAVVPAHAPLDLPEPRRGVVKPLPKARMQPRWLTQLRIAQRCSTVVATGLVAAALVIYGTTVYTQQRWGNQYSELNQAEKERSLMDAFGGSLKQNYAEQASQPGSPLSGQPTPQYKIPLEPESLRPLIEIPPEEPTVDQPHNFPKGY
ncbi:MAG: hypothetical protein WBA57_19230 [Elainellaceae cyanobacterium]